MRKLSIALVLLLALKLGAAAPKWAEKILHPPSRLDKLGVKAGMRVSLVGVKDENLGSEIAERSATSHT